MLFVLVFYGVFQYIVVHVLDPNLKIIQVCCVSVVVIIQLCVVLVFFPIEGFVAYKVYCEFGWSMIRKIGNDLKIVSMYIYIVALIIDMYRLYQTFITLVQMDFAMSIITFYMGTMWLLKLNWEIYADVLGLVVSIAWVVVGVASVCSCVLYVMMQVRYEDVNWSYAFWCFSFIEPIYIVRKIMEVFTIERSQLMSVQVYVILFEGKHNYYYLTKGIFDLVLRLVCLAAHIMCYRNFGKGLKAASMYIVHVT